MRFLKITRWQKALLFAVIVLLGQEASATTASWTPRFGSLKTEQKTDIKLVAQEIALFDFQEVVLSTGRTHAFNVKALFTLRNTSRNKKKPTVLLPICSVKGRFDPASSCSLKKSDIKIKVGGKTISATQSVRDNTVYARFSVKFGPHVGRKIEVTYRIFERLAGKLSKSPTRAFATFDYHIEDGASWSGTIGATRFTVSLPFQASNFNAKMFSKGEKFKYRNRFAYYEKRKLNLDNDDGLSFYITTLNYKNRVDHSKKRVQALPKNLKRRVAHVNLLASYPGARDEIVKHLTLVVNKRLKKWDTAKKKHAVQVYTQYLIESNRFTDDARQCDANICVENQTISDIIDATCFSNASCKEERQKKLSDCCNLGQS